MIQKEIRIFRNTGLNSDDDLDFMQGGDSRNRHLMGYINGDYDSLIPRKVPSSLGLILPDGTNNIIGIAKDEENEAAILFIHNYNSGPSVYGHSIIRVYSDGSQGNISFAQSGWGFSLDYPIYDPKVIGKGDSAMLTWTDNNTPPRLINMKKFADGVHVVPGRGNSYLHSPSPIEKPVLTLSYDSGVDYSKISGSIFQFAYRFVFDDNRKSVLSPYSDVVYNYGDDYANESMLNVLYNYIQVVVSTDDWSNIDRVEIFSRELDVGSGALGFWKHYDTIKVSGSTATSRFYNNEDGIYYSDADLSDMSDSVPFKCRSLEFIKGNRIALADFNYGRDPITPNVTLTQNNVANGDESNVVADAFSYIKLSSGSPTGYADIKLAWGDENLVIVEVVEVSGTEILKEETYTISSADYEDGSESSYYNNNDLIDALASVIIGGTSTELSAVARSAGSGTPDRIQFTASFSDAVNIHVNIFVVNSRTKVRSMKENAKAYFGIEYIFPDGRESRVYTNSNMNIQISRGTSGTYVVGDKISVNYSISHLAPSGASHYRFVYGGSSIPYWFYLPVRFFEAGKAYFTTGDSDITRSGSKLKLNLTQALNRVEDQNGYNLKTFTPVVGDYIRLVGQVAAGSNVMLRATPNQEFFLITNVEESEGSTYLYFSSSDLQSMNLSGGTNYPVLMLEIFRRQELEDVENLRYREVGALLPVSGVYHVGGSTTQTSGVPATGTIDFGNCYQYPVYWMYTFPSVSPQLNGDVVQIISRGEFMSSYLTQPSMHYGQGRANYVNNDEKNRDYAAIIVGGAYRDSDISYNQLNRFIFGRDTEYLNEKHGPIYAIREMGKTLYSFQRSKVTALRLYERLVDDGNQVVNIGISDVFGTVTPFEEDFGTIYPGSISKFGRALWFYDPLNASVWQLAQNGLTDISANKMKSFFYELSRDIDGSYDNYNFLSFYDVITQSYVLIHIDLSVPANNWSISYYPAINKWGNTDNYKYGGGVSIGGNRVLSFDSRGYEHHSDSADYEAGYIDVHFNQPVLERKLWRNIQVDSDYLYTANNNPSVWVDTTRPNYVDVHTRVNLGGSMRSRIPSAVFKRVNGKYVAPFLRSTISKNGTLLQDNALYGGSLLAGKHATIRLTNSSSGAENPLRAVTVGFQIKGQRK